MYEILGESAIRTVAETWRTLTSRERFSLTLGSVVCALLAVGLAKVLRIPGEPGVAGALLQQSGLIIAIIFVWLVLVGGSLLGAVFTLRLHYDAGLFCAAIALAALSARFGPVKYAVFHATGKGVFLLMAAELLILWIPVAAGWVLLYRMSRKGLLPAEVLLDPTEPDLSIDQKALAMLSQGMLMVLMLLLLCQSDSKAQSLASVGIASFVGSIGAHYLVATRPSIWYWTAPLLVGLFGYLMQYVTPGIWIIGDVGGFFAPLARPVPMDYISMGTAGTLLGYWTSQRWQHESIHAADAN